MSKLATNAGIDTTGIQTIADTPLDQLIVGVTRVRSIATGWEGVISRRDDDTRHGSENPAIHILWDDNDYESSWWWMWFDTVEVLDG
jgi:hypothetical protein